MKLFKQVRKYGRQIAVAGVAAGASVSSFAAAMDFSAMTGAVDASTVVTAIVAMGAIMILPSVAKWSVKKVATFFG